MSEVREDSRREYCRDCPVDQTTGLCKEHTVLLNTSKWAVRFFATCMIGIFMTMGSIHWRVSEIQGAQAVIQNDIGHMQQEMAEIKRDVKTHLRETENGD